MGIKLDLGCGNKTKPGYIGVDVSEDVDAEVVHDLNVFPWPWPDNHFDQIMALDVLEHLDDIYAVLNEAHRVIQSGCELYIRGNPENELPYDLGSLDGLELWRVSGKSQNRYMLSLTLIAQPEEVDEFQAVEEIDNAESDQPDRY